MSKRPENEDELQKREAIGVIRASRFVRKYSHSHHAITADTVREIHREIFKNAWPEIAGRYRDENIEITDSKHLPPHHSEVAKKMLVVEQQFSARVQSLKESEGILSVFQLRWKRKTKIVIARRWLKPTRLATLSRSKRLFMTASLNGIKG